ncbi:FAD-dependent monooxygenase DEP4 [Fusarium oxysporum f. sp. rapae]|uniref:FAD-dependent monooxygenase DEP4 n=1 Tax=Fusarium oxysporum f. sp. rapae TaxID=485398 RepID=A0A8J5NDJ1_FUSOX|nr:FAD-dependent monooxygenase DEP4 [Fusarium oxysporum f. sp. rapae]
MASPSGEKHEVDLAIVGAGLAGLNMAKTYSQCDPDTSIMIMEQVSTLGGVWAKEKLYPGLKTNNLRGTYEWSDYPLYDSYGAKDGEHISGATLHAYFTSYAKDHDLVKLVKFETRIECAEKLEDGWVLTGLTNIRSEQPKEFTVMCRKLAIATGLTSTPRKMYIQGEENFRAPLFHHVEFAQKSDLIINDPNIKTVTVFGGSKTAFDYVHYFASSGKEVEWVIRKSGHGTSWISPSYLPILGKNIQVEKLPDTRAVTWISPCIWGEKDYPRMRALLNNTKAGRFVIRTVWKYLENLILSQNAFATDAEVAKLRPLQQPFWSNIAILNYSSNIYDYVSSGQVRVHRKDVAHLSDHTIHFDDGTSVTTDAMIRITGWEFAPPIKFKPEGIDGALGIPSLSYTKQDTVLWEELTRMADVEILKRFPILKNAPVTIDKNSLMVDPLAKADSSKSQASYTPYRLYRFIVPPGLTRDGDHSLVFLKMMGTTSNTKLAEVQSIWAYAYFNHQVKIDRENVYRETALFNRFNRWRYPFGFGARYPDTQFDTLAYMNMLMSDLGINIYRKGNAFKEIFQAYEIKDYKGMVNEFLANRDLNKLKAEHLSSNE